jgi:hypothetical protein
MNPELLIDLQARDDLFVAWDYGDHIRLVGTGWAQAGYPMKDGGGYVPLSGGAGQRFKKALSKDEVPNFCDIEGEMKFHIEDVAVCPEGERNPYRYQGPWKIGAKREEALRLFAAGTPPPGLVLWLAPSCGGARKIDPSEVDWRGLKR